MTVHIKKLKVRQRKAPNNVMCATQLSAMLGCWAASGDLHSVEQCKVAADTLFNCMRTTALIHILLPCAPLCFALLPFPSLNALFIWQIPPWHTMCPPLNSASKHTSRTPAYAKENAPIYH
ncbi:hypothetical protein B0H34DRAFT_303202 [Crassisporium funariophilum]|nr:hypothetical protein B0H34DRAFT_303202 [Crassisporium funariophilum]